MTWQFIPSISGFSVHILSALVNLMLCSVRALDAQLMIQPVILMNSISVSIVERKTSQWKGFVRQRIEIFQIAASRSKSLQPLACSSIYNRSSSNFVYYRNRFVLQLDFFHNGFSFAQIWSNKIIESVIEFIFSSFTRYICVKIGELFGSFS